MALSRLCLHYSRMYAMVMGSVVVLAAALSLRIYRNGNENQYIQVVNWVAEHVREEQWVGAPQSGTLGFFHDRTVNLDGKVNPEALAARLEGIIPEYIATRTFDETGRRIEYIADWQYISAWAKRPKIESNFDLIVHDVPANLAVLKRKQ